jgi:hypothetical protein
MSKRTAIVLAVATVLIGAAGAGGYSIGRAVDVRPGGGAVFLPSHRVCQNFGTRVDCENGDAFPYASLTTTRGGGITVKVHTLRDPRGGHVTRTYEKGLPVYVFTAF